MALLFGLAGIFGMHIVPMQEQVLALFVTLSASSFLSASIVSKFEKRLAQGRVP